MSDISPHFANLNGKFAVVTGSSSGIGKAIALELAAAGADVCVHYANSRQAAETVTEEIRQLGQQSSCFQCDLSNCDHAAVVEALWKERGIDIWINNAGVDLLTGDGAKLDYPEKLQKLMQIDVSGTVLLSRAIAAKMQHAGNGVILNIGWDQADRGMEGESAELFSTAKNAIMGFTRSLAMSVAPEVRVNCIAPGWIQTAWGDQAGSEWQARVIDETPLRRWGQPQDIAKLARFLVSDEASYITGQVINCNGGAIR